MGLSGGLANNGGVASSAPSSPINLVTASASPVLANKLLLGDANPAFQINGNGKVQWGPGGASALNINLYPNGAVIQTDNEVDSASYVRAFATSAINAANGVLLGYDVVGAANAAAVSFGASNGDASLVRTAAATLTVKNTLLTLGGAGFWGHAAPGSQPAAPATLADVIAIIRGCGLSA